MRKEPNGRGCRRGRWPARVPRRATAPAAADRTPTRRGSGHPHGETRAPSCSGCLRSHRLGPAAVRDRLWIRHRAWRSPGRAVQSPFVRAAKSRDRHPARPFGSRWARIPVRATATAPLRKERGCLDLVSVCSERAVSHPTWFVFESYIDPHHQMKHVQPAALKSEALGYATMEVVQLVAILGAQVLSKFGLHVQLLRDVDAWWGAMKVQMLAERTAHNSPRDPTSHA